MKLNAIFLFMIGLVLLSILPTMGEIITEERDGVLYVSNVFLVDSRFEMVDVGNVETLGFHDCSEAGGALYFNDGDFKCVKDEPPDSTSSETKYDKLMEKGQEYSQDNKPGLAEMHFWKAGEFELWQNARLLEAQNSENNSYFLNAALAYESLGDIENANRNYVLDAQEDEAKGYFYIAARPYGKIGMWDEVHRLMALQKEKMQNTLVD